MSDLIPFPDDLPPLVSQPPPAVAPSPPSLTVPGKPPAKPWLIGVLYYGAIDREHDQCIRRLKQHPYIADVLELTGCPYIDIGRSIIATHVLDHPEFGGLLFFDHDMVFEVAEAVKLIEAAEAAEAVVGAAYSMRRPGKIIGHVDGSKLPPGTEIRFFDGGQLLPAAYLGMGMTAMHRSVLERLVDESDKHYSRQMHLIALLRTSLPGVATPILDELIQGHLLYKRLPRLSSGISEAPVVPFFSHLQRPDMRAPEGTEGFYLGEDVSFAIRNHEANVPVRLDTRIRVYHKGAYCYGLEDVGMEVPFCSTLVALDVPDPKMMAALPNASVQAALDPPQLTPAFGNRAAWEKAQAEAAP